MVSKFAKNPSSKHFYTIDQVLRYLTGSQDRDIMFGGEKKLKLVGYLDLDWERDYANWKSISGFIFMLNRGPVSYAFKKQAVVALLSTKTKYVTLSLAA